MRILWAVLCEHVIVSENGDLAGMYNPLSAYIFRGKPEVRQTPYEIPASHIHVVLMCYNETNLDGEFSISVSFLPPTGSQIASGGAYYHGLRIVPGGREVFHFDVAPLYYEVDGDYEVKVNAYKGGQQLGHFTTLIHISAVQ